MIRLDRFLANMGVGTRKEVKKFVSAGAVTVNGKIAGDSGMQITWVRFCEVADAICLLLPRH